MALRDVLIVGAGPSGLATAIAARRLGLDALVVERGTVAEGILRFPVNMVFFTTPEGLEIGGMPFTTHLDKPTRVEALRYYRKVSEAYGLPMALHEDVQDVVPEPQDGEVAFAVTTRDRHGVTRAREARSSRPRPACAPGGIARGPDGGRVDRAARPGLPRAHSHDPQALRAPRPRVVRARPRRLRW